MLNVDALAPAVFNCNMEDPDLLLRWKHDAMASFMDVSLVHMF